MSKLDRLFDRLLPGLIWMCPIGAIAYYNADLEQETSPRDTSRAERRALVSDVVLGAAAIPLAHS